MFIWFLDLLLIHFRCHLCTIIVYLSNFYKCILQFIESNSNIKGFKVPFSVILNFKIKNQNVNSFQNESINKKYSLQNIRWFLRKWKISNHVPFTIGTYCQENDSYPCIWPSISHCATECDWNFNGVSCFFLFLKRNCGIKTFFIWKTFIKITIPFSKMFLKIEFEWNFRYQYNFELCFPCQQFLNFRMSLENAF